MEDEASKKALIAQVAEAVGSYDRELLDATLEVAELEGHSHPALDQASQLQDALNAQFGALAAASEERDGRGLYLALKALKKSQLGPFDSEALLAGQELLQEIEREASAANSAAAEATANNETATTPKGSDATANLDARYSDEEDFEPEAAVGATNGAPYSDEEEEVEPEAANAADANGARYSDKEDFETEAANVAAAGRNDAPYSDEEDFETGAATVTANDAPYSDEEEEEVEADAANAADVIDARYSDEAVVETKAATAVEVKVDETTADNEPAKPLGDAASNAVSDARYSDEAVVETKAATAVEVKVDETTADNEPAKPLEDAATYAVSDARYSDEAVVKTLEGSEANVVTGETFDDGGMIETKTATAAEVGEVDAAALNDPAATPQVGDESKSAPDLQSSGDTGMNVPQEFYQPEPKDQAPIAETATSGTETSSDVGSVSDQSTTLNDEERLKKLAKKKQALREKTAKKIAALKAAKAQKAVEVKSEQAKEEMRLKVLQRVAELREEKPLEERLMKISRDMTDPNEPLVFPSLGTEC